MRNRILWICQCLTLAVVSFVVAPPIQAQKYTYSTVASFAAGGPSGPSSLIIDASGNLYGTSVGGGKYSFGTVFKVTPKGVVTVLHSFNGTTEGSGPNSLARDIRQGNLYGTTSTTVFKMALGKNGSYTFSTLYSDTTNPNLGAAMLDSKGNLYGTGYGNVTAQTCPWDDACLWEIPAGGVLTNLYDSPFVGDTEATSNIIMDQNGSLFAGFAFEDISGGGYVLEYPSDDELGEQDLPADITSLRQDATGDIYGSAYGNQGGGDNLGIVFKLTVAGVFSTLYNFCSIPTCPDGSNPGNLTLDSKKNIFGTNTVGVFELTAAGVESTIYSGTVGTGLVMDKSGNLYGTTFSGGSKKLGSVFKLTKN